MKIVLNLKATALKIPTRVTFVLVTTAVGISASYSAKSLGFIPVTWFVPGQVKQRVPAIQIVGKQLIYPAGDLTSLDLSDGQLSISL